MRAALVKSELSWQKCQDLFGSLRLRSGADALGHALEVQPWQLSGEDGPKAYLASLFCDSAKLFHSALESAPSSVSDARQAASLASEAFVNALVCFHVAMYTAGESSKPQSRQIELDAVRGIAHTHLLWAKTFEPLLDRIFSANSSVDPATAITLSITALFGGSAKGRDSCERAAWYFELEGRLHLKLDSAREAAEAYSTAADLYAKAESFLKAAELKSLESRVRERLRDSTRAAEALEDSKKYLLKGDPAAPDTAEKAAQAVEHDSLQQKNLHTDPRADGSERLPTVGQPRHESTESDVLSELSRRHPIVDGDSGGAALFVTQASALGQVPIKQGLGLTGALDEYGNILPVDGVREKIEGWYYVCRANGFTGEQGAIIPKDNLSDLALPREVEAAVLERKFCIYAVAHVDEVLELMSGIWAEEFHRRVRERLKISEEPVDRAVSLEITLHASDLLGLWAGMSQAMLQAKERGEPVDDWKEYLDKLAQSLVAKGAFQNFFQNAGLDVRDENPKKR